MELRNELDVLQNQYLQNARNATIAIVVRVFEHDDPNDKSNHEVNVMLRDQGKELRRVPVLGTRAGHTAVPKIGDAVLVEFLDGTSLAPVVTERVYTEDTRAPLARSGHWRHEFGPDRTESLYVEAETSDHSAGEPDVVRIAKKADGLSDPSTSIELDDSGATPVVRIQTDGDVDINVAGQVTISAGSVVIDEGGTPKKVATEDHTHTATLSDGTTATTSKPDDITSTEID